MVGKIEVRFSQKFRKQYKKLERKVKKQFEKRLGIFLNDDFNPVLKNHQLRGRLEGYRSINITGDWRALYTKREIDGKGVFVFEAIGTHSQLYR